MGEAGKEDRSSQKSPALHTALQASQRYTCQPQTEMRHEGPQCTTHNRESTEGFIERTDQRDKQETFGNGGTASGCRRIFIHALLNGNLLGNQRMDGACAAQNVCQLPGQIEEEIRKTFDQTSGRKQETQRSHSRCQ